MSSKPNLGVVVASILSLLALSGLAWAEPNLVSWWEFDEGIGTAAYDSAGDNDGILNGDPEWVAGQIGDYALDFDGDGDCVDFGDIDEFEFGDANFTIASWFYTQGPHSAYDGYGDIVGKYNYGGDGRQWVIYQDPNGRIDFYTNPTGQWATDEHLWSNDAYQGQWTHIVAVRNGSTKVLYVNGAPDNTGATAGVLTGKSSKVYVGCRENPSGRGYFFNGMIDDVRVYNRALTAEEIEVLYLEGAGPIAHWRFDEGIGTTAYDSAGDNDGILNGDPEWVAGQIGDYALDFDGHGDYVSISSMTLSTSWSFSGWLRSCYDAKNPIIGGPGTWKNYLILRHNADDIALETNTDGDAVSVCRGVINSSVCEWAHYTITRSGNTVCGYKNGVFVDSDSLPIGDDNTFDKIGAGYSITDYFGSIDDVRIYDRALSAEEVWELYERALAIIVDVDIKPGSCPNPLNLKSRGVLPIAVLGTEEFDVGNVDPVSVRLAGVAAIRHSYEDVAGPVVDGSECECATEGADGYDDLTLKFRTQEIVRRLIDAPGELAKGQTLVLTLTGELFDGKGIQGADCVVLVGNVPRWLAALRWDANADGIVNMRDFAEFANYWLESSDAQ